MPASIAHMLIAQKVREKLQDFTDDEFNALLQTHKNYMDLGALGPDLPYYESMVRAGYNLLAGPLGQTHGRGPVVLSAPLQGPQRLSPEDDRNHLARGRPRRLRMGPG